MQSKLIEIYRLLEIVKSQLNSIRISIENEQGKLLFERRKLGLNCERCFHYSGGKGHCLPLEASTCSPLTGERFESKEEIEKELQKQEEVDAFNNDELPRTHVQNLPNS